MYDQSLEQLIDAVIADGVITDQERRVVLKKAASLGIDQDEIEVYLEGRLDALKKSYMPKSGKHGVVKTCPNCGATVESGLAKCKECGFAFTGIDANSSAKLLDERLRAIRGTEDEDNEKRANIISSFPIPTTREDLIEFMAALEPKIGGKNSISKASQQKFIECLNKAVISFPDDPATLMFLDKRKSYERKRNIILGGWISLIVIAVLSISIMLFRHNARQAALRQELEDWRQTAQIEISEYATELDNQLKAIPTPTSKNYKECQDMWSRVVWSKEWWEPSKFGSVVDKYPSGTPMHRNLSAAAQEAFLNKKNQIGKAISGYTHFECRDHTSVEKDRGNY